MKDPVLIDIFLRFGLAALLGFAIGLDRSIGIDDETQKHTGLRDFEFIGTLNDPSINGCSEDCLNLSLC